MSNSPIFFGYSHSFDVSVAEYFNDVNVAIVLNHIIFWIKKNKAKEVNQIQGRTWMYETSEEIAKQFPYFTERQVKYCIGKLLESGILLKGNFSKNKFDHTAWYALSDEDSIFKKQNTKGQNCPIDRTELSDLSDEIVPSIYNDKDKKTDKKKDIRVVGSNLSPAIAVDDYPLFLSKYFEKSIKSHIPDFSKKNLDSWAKTFDLMIRVDNYDPEEIKKIIDWLPTDTFNRDKVLSPDKLRKRYFELRSQSQQKPMTKDDAKANRSYALAAVRQLESKNYMIDALCETVEVIAKTGSVQPFSLRYDAKGFKEQLDNHLRKREFYTVKQEKK